LATGECHSVRAFVEKAFRMVGIELEWRGADVEECGIDASSGRVLVEVDPRYFRLTEVDLLIGDSTKAHEKLGWRHQTRLDDLISEMVRNDLRIMARSVPPAHANKGLVHV
jgi:GDPmannose 4,6-dehydratase